MHNNTGVNNVGTQDHFEIVGFKINSFYIGYQKICNHL